MPALVGLLLAACTAAHGATMAAATSPQGPYAALGDSYTSGPDIPAQAGIIAGSALSGPANERLGTKLAVTTGMLLATAGLCVLTAASPTSGYARVLAATARQGRAVCREGGRPR